MNLLCVVALVVVLLPLSTFAINPLPRPGQPTPESPVDPLPPIPLPTLPLGPGC